MLVALVFYYVTIFGNLIGNQSTLEGFLKRKLPPATNNGNNHGDASRT
jgi:hypothetical protein